MARYRIPEKGQELSDSDVEYLLRPANRPKNPNYKTGQIAVVLNRG